MMAILNLNTDVLPYLGLSADDSFNHAATTLSEVEEFAKTYCNRNFEFASYKEQLIRRDHGAFVLKNTPLVSIKKVTTELLDVLSVTNTNEFSAAVVAVDSNSVNLTYNTTSSIVTFAANATLDNLATSINALGNGWVATVASGKGSMLSTELIEEFGQDALNNKTVNLQALGSGISYRVLDSSSGIIETLPLTANTGTSADFLVSGNLQSSNLTMSVRPAVRLLYVSYSAGYTSSNMPADLKVAMLKLISFWYDKVKTGGVGFNVKSFKIDAYGKTFGDSVDGSSGMLPKEISVTLNKYRSISI